MNCPHCGKEINMNMNAYDGVRALIEANPIEGYETVLESLVDKYGLGEVVSRLALVVEAKAVHIRDNWQDETLASRWETNAVKLAKLKLQ